MDFEDLLVTAGHDCLFSGTAKKWTALGPLGDVSHSFDFHARVSKWSCCARSLCLLCSRIHSRPIVRGEMAEPLRALHAAIPRTIIIHVPDIDLFKHTIE